jgi:hypothetical protein
MHFLTSPIAVLAVEHWTFMALLPVVVCDTITCRVPGAQTERRGEVTRPVDPEGVPSFFAVGTHRQLFHAIYR